MRSRSAASQPMELVFAFPARFESSAGSRDFDCSCLQIPQTTTSMEPDTAHETVAAVSVWALAAVAAMNPS